MTMSQPASDDTTVDAAEGTAPIYPADRKRAPPECLDAYLHDAAAAADAAAAQETNSLEAIAEEEEQEEEAEGGLEALIEMFEEGEKTLERQARTIDLSVSPPPTPPRSPNTIKKDAVQKKTQCEISFIEGGVDDAFDTIRHRDYTPIEQLLQLDTSDWESIRLKKALIMFPLILKQYAS